MPFTTTTPPGSAPAVLCVTENRAFLNRLRSSLADAGFSVMTCRSGAEVFDLLAVSKFDIIILDQSLTQTDGLTLWYEIRRSLAHEAPPTLIATDRWSPALLAQVMETGAAGMILSTSRGEEIVQHVGGLLANKEHRTAIERGISERVMDGGIDSVTRIANSDHFLRRLMAESIASQRDSHDLAVLMVSIDLFEVILKRHGTERVDDLLAQVARVIEGDLRTRDCVARYSDRIFAVILSEADLQAAAAVGRRLAQTLANTEFGDLDQPIAITVSVGAACRPSGIQGVPSEIVSAALNGCVAAGKLGGNRVVADRSLTGKPVALVVCGDPEQLVTMAESLSHRRMDVRRAGSIEDAKRVLVSVPVSLLLAIDDGRPRSRDEALELLSWARAKAPGARRALATSSMDLPAAIGAINGADVHWLLAVPWLEESLSEAVERLVHS